MRTPERIARQKTAWNANIKKDIERAERRKKDGDEYIEARRAAIERMMREQ